MINQLIHIVTEHGLNETVYDAFIAAGLLLTVVYCVATSGKYSISKKTALISILILIVINDFWVKFLCWAEQGFKNWGSMNMIRIFVWYPLFLYPVAKLTKTNWETWCDYHAPIMCMIQGMANFGCMFAGCCHGYAMVHGLYNPVYGTTMFPLQPLKAAITVLIGCYIWHTERKRGYAVTGESYPLMMIIYGVARFFMEFACDNPKVLLGLSSPAIHAVILVVVGTAWYTTVRDRNKKRDRKKISKMMRNGGVRA